MNNRIGAAALLDELPKAWLLGESRLRRRLVSGRLAGQGRIEPCILGRRSRNEPVKCDKRRYRYRSSIEIMFERLKNWRPVATRHDRCPTVFSAIALAATVTFWL